MKFFIAAALLTAISHTFSEDDAAKTLQFELDGADWSAISIRQQTRLSDLSKEGPYLMIQRLPDERTVVSNFVGRHKSQFPPAAIRYINNEELNQILSKIFEIFSRGKTKDQKLRGHTIFHPPITTMEISIRTPNGQKDFTRILDDGENLTNFIAMNLDPTQVEQSARKQESGN